MTAAELDSEPIDQFFTNLFIYNLMKEKEADEAKLRELESKHGQ